MKILFILKHRIYNDAYASSYGLLNSATEVAEALRLAGHETKVVTVIDGNFIDREVYNWQPNLVIIEALWVTGAKMKELMSLPRYKKVKWVIRVHSDIGFLTSEGQALQYINDYLEINNPHLFVAPNHKEFEKILESKMHSQMTYLPNLVEVEQYFNLKVPERDVIDVGCFGALRVLKNQGFQALVAMEAADRLGKKLRFHINGNVKNDPNPVLNNLKVLFERNGYHELIEHPWLNHKDFMALLRNEIDLGMQISFTESFNIVTTDFINAGLLILVSEAIDWMPNYAKTSTTDYEKAVKAFIKLYKCRNCWMLKRKNQKALSKLILSNWDRWECFIHRIEILGTIEKKKKMDILKAAMHHV